MKKGAGQLRGGTAGQQGGREWSKALEVSGLCCGKGAKGYVDFDYLL